MSDNFDILNDGEETEITMEDLAGVQLDGVEAKFAGFEKTPPCLAAWKIKEASIEAMGDNPAFVFLCECVKVYEVAEGFKLNPGFEHQEIFFIQDIAKTLPNVVAFLQKLGIATTGSAKELLDKSVGSTFVAKVVHTRNKKEPENPYANMQHRGIMTVEEAEALVA
jgi:hypothetical protein